jgi:ribosomal protein S18 acetylase RimI-like enzyme
VIKQRSRFSLKAAGFSTQDVERFAEIHRTEIQDGFLTSLGPEALRLLYCEIVVNQNCIVVAGLQEEDARPVGFIVGTLDCAGFYRDFLRRKGMTALRVFLPRLLSWSRMKKAFETLRYPTKKRVPTLPNAEILNFAVQPFCRGTGLAQILFLELMRRFKARGVQEVKIVTGEGQKRAHRFYEKMGAQCVAGTSVHKGHIDSVFLFEIS